MRREAGTAVIMAMLVVAAAATLVSGALWQQNALIRETGNELAQAQARWLLRGAIDWAGVILQEDLRTSTIDHRGEPWAVPLADTRLNENDGRPPAYLAGAIDDEQAKFNLRNLVAAGGQLDPAELRSLERLLAALNIDTRFAGRIAERLTTEFRSRESVPAPGLAFVEDLLLALDAAPRERLRPFVTVLPEPTLLNVNTAPAELLAARVTGLELVDARRLASARDRAPFKDMGDAITRLREASPQASEAGLAVATRYFSVEGTVSYGPARLAARALVKREANRLEILWLKELG